MAIVHWPDDVTPQTTVTCTICGQQAHAAQATAGMRDVHGQQAFACSAHLKERNLILGWTDYAILQRSQPTDHEFNEQEGADEYLLY